MDEDMKKSILEMCNGAFLERADYEIGHIMANILDPNTDAKAKRTLVLKLVLQPDANRQNIAVYCESEAKLAKLLPVATTLYVAGDQDIVELPPQIPGQQNLLGPEQDVAPVLRIVQTA